MSPRQSARPITITTPQWPSIITTSQKLSTTFYHPKVHLLQLLSKDHLLKLLLKNKIEEKVILKPDLGQLQQNRKQLFIRLGLQPQFYDIKYNNLGLMTQGYK